MIIKNLIKKSDIKIRESKADVPKGLYVKCKSCKSPVLADDVKRNSYVCPKCGGYFRLNARNRLKIIADKKSFEEWFCNSDFVNPLKDAAYMKKWTDTREKTKTDEAVITGKISVKGSPAAIAIMDGRFMMASMGSIVGEKITKTIEKAQRENLPLIIVACSGGARMQEGIVCLMQMAKTSAALKKYRNSGNLYISLLTDPTTGGVTASFAMLGDIILAEPNALIGFAGQRVIEQTIGQKLPKGFQSSEFLLEHGFIDAIVERDKLKNTLSYIIKMHYESDKNANYVSQTKTDNAVRDKLTPWERVVKARDKMRPTGLDYINGLIDDFMEFHGDRYFGDDRAIVGGIGYFHGKPVTVIANTKGHNTKDSLKHNFGMANPEGYRKSIRLMKQAEKFKRPIICFVDTAGAFCGVEAEMRGQGEAIANNLFEMSDLKVPVLSIVIGEGGSGGALALAVADEVWMLKNSVYSILSPEGYASILFRGTKKPEEVAGLMKLTSFDLLQLNIIEKIIDEPEHYSVENMEETIKNIDEEIQGFLSRYESLNALELVEKRYDRFRRM